VTIPTCAPNGRLPTPRMGSQRLALVQTWIAALATIIAGLGTYFVISTLKETRRSANAAVAAANAANKANQLNRKAFVADQRPWLRVHQPTVAARWSGKTGEPSSAFCSRSKTLAHPRRCTPVSTSNCSWNPADCAWRSQRRFADEIRSRQNKTGYTVFPRLLDKFSRGLTATSQEATVAIKNMGADDVIMPFLIGCASYYSASARNSTRQGSSMNWCEQGRPLVISPSQGNVPAEDLVLCEWLRPGHID
jgi:hypothetical protein